MVIIEKVSDRYFDLNGIRYAKIYQPLAVGSDSLGIYNQFDIRQQLQSGIHYSLISVDGETFEDQTDAIEAVLSAVYTEDGVNFYNTTNNFSTTGDIINNPDDEDLVADTSVIKLKDRAYTAGGQRGYKIIRSDFNWVSIPSSYQDSIWEIRYEFDLLAATSNIPSNVTLLFNGGIIKNGTLNFDNTTIESRKKYDTLFESVSFSGVSNQSEIYAEWFGAKGDDATDNTAFLNSAMSYFKDVDFNFDNGIYITGSLINNNTIHLKGTGTLKAETNISNHLISPNAEIQVSGLTLDGNKANQTGSFDLITSTFKIKMLNCKGINSKRYGFRTVGGHESVVLYCHFDDNSNDCIHFKNVEDGFISGVTTSKTNMGHIIELLDDCNNNIVRGNILNPIQGGKFAVEVWSNTTNGIGNLIDNNVIDADSTSGGISISKGLKNIVSNNNIKNCLTVACIELAQGASFNLVHTNYCENSYRMAITGAASLDVEFNKVFNNHIKDPIQNGGAGGQGIYMSLANKNEVYNNTVEGGIIHSFQLENCDNNIIKGNNLTNGLLSAFYLSNCENNTFDDNFAENFTAGGRYYFQLAGTNVNNIITKNKGNNNNAAISDYSTVNEFGNMWEQSNSLKGSITLTSGTASVILNKNITANSKITLSPTDSAAAAISGIYISAKTTKASFTITHSVAAGSETFSYSIE